MNRLMLKAMLVALTAALLVSMPRPPAILAAAEPEPKAPAQATGEALLRHRQVAASYAGLKSYAATVLVEQRQTVGDQTSSSKVEIKIALKRPDMWRASVRA